MTIAHLRTYTINTGCLDSWINLFHSKLTPLMEDAGMKVESTWVNEKRSQFIWIRSYGDKVENYPKMDAAFKGSDWWKANVDHVRSHISHMEVIQIESI